MEFMIESYDGISLSTGDLLITTTGSHNYIWIDCVLYDKTNLCYVTAASRLKVNGNLDFARSNYTPMFDNSVDLCTQHMAGMHDSAHGIWHPVPHDLWSDIVNFVLDNTY
jgi:hypothetical protein